ADPAGGPGHPDDQRPEDLRPGADHPAGVGAGRRQRAGPRDVARLVRGRQRLRAGQRGGRAAVPARPPGHGVHHPALPIGGPMPAPAPAATPPVAPPPTGDDARPAPPGRPPLARRLARAVGRAPLNLLLLLIAAFWLLPT